MRQDKRYAQTNQGLGLVMHSQEGSGLDVMKRIHNADPAPSFMFWLALDGTLYQFSPVTASVWCSGSFQANTRFWPVEMEGKAKDPINEAQMETAMRLIREWETHTGMVASRGPEFPTMFEHREIATMWEPNAGPTACPSERYAPLWEKLSEEPDMTEDQVRAIVLEELRKADLVGDGIPTLKRLAKADVARFKAIHVATDPDHVPGDD